MQLKDFLYYPDMSCRMGVMPCVEWLGSRNTHQPHSLLKRIWFIVGVIQLIYQNFGMIIHMYLSAQQSKPRSELVAEIAEAFSIMTLTLVGVCNLRMMIHYRDDIESLLSEFQTIFPDNVSKEQNDLITKHYKKSARLMKIVDRYIRGTVFFYNLLPIVELVYELTVESEHFRYNAQSSTFYPWHSFVAPDSIINYIACYLCQMHSSVIGGAFIIAGPVFLTMFIAQLQIHFKIMVIILRDLDAKSPEANNQLKQLIAYHSQVLRMASNINRIFNLTFFVSFAISSLAICMIAYAMTMISLNMSIKYGPGFIAFLIINYNICRNGENFISTHDELLPAAFYNNWYEGDMEFQKMLYLFMMSSSENRVLRAYQFTPVCMESYMNMLKFSYQLFTFVQTME